MSPDRVRFAPVERPLRGELCVPPDKSITHRALMIAAVCSDPVYVGRPLWAGDTLSTASCLGDMGVRIESANVGRGVGEPGDVLVRGVGLDGLATPDGSLDAGNSGTTLRLLAGLAAGGAGRVILDGDQSLRRRPMDRIVEPLRLMGVNVEASEGRFPPVTLDRGRVDAVTYAPPIASAQVKSCVLLAGLHAHGVTTVVERTPSRDHTERLLGAAGADVRNAGGAVTLQGRPALGLEVVHVPGDVSSAAFLVTAAALVPGSHLEIRELGLNPTRMGFYQVLRRMGARVTWGAQRTEGEPSGVLRVEAGPLHGVRVPPEEIPLLIDEVPLLALVATGAEGETVIEGVAELRHKESDRLAAVAAIIGGLGGHIEVDGDALLVRHGRLRGGLVDSRGDHRLAMLGAVAGLVSREGVTVDGFAAAAVSFPGFQRTLEEVLG